MTPVAGVSSLPVGAPSVLQEERGVVQTMQEHRHPQHATPVPRRAAYEQGAVHAEERHLEQDRAQRQGRR